MRNARDAFHLAIPCRDLDEAFDYYVNRLKCGSARRFDDRITVNFFGDQVVCHLSPDRVDRAPDMYPRHFGMTLKERPDFERILQRALEHELAFFKPLFVRFSGQPEEHSAFFLIDPSNNLIEFKHYKNQDMMY
jgi:extradiol dioxygenase family protein